MVTVDESVQFREPPVGALPENTSTSASRPDTSAQFREPVVRDPSATNDSTDGSTNNKPMSEKIKNVLKKPFSSSSSHHSSKLGETEVTSPELQAAQEVLAAKHLTTTS
ncbi:hypothetical protein yc1106_00457 [Curvularia clavata]|uniref:Uncharacterized protein n=1 Tax=Curvularia clavata TaxID=95742 RepID=A0A9Q8Z2J0_CURCL|nr:hypothetical protein yc1106_00457 [Curvularia clavata]